MKYSIVNKLAMTAVGTFIVAGSAMAVSPYAFDQYSVAGGIITMDTGAGLCGDTGPGGFSCMAMEAQGQGILQQQITSNDTGVSYLQSIVVEDDATGTAASLDFSQEVYTFTSGTNTNNVAVKQHMSQNSVDITMYVQERAFETGADVSDASSSGDGVHFNLAQVVDLSVGGNGDYLSFTQDGANTSDRQVIKESLDGGNITMGLVQVDGAYAPTTASTTPLGGGNMEDQVDWLAGEALSALVLGNDQSGNPVGQDFAFIRFQNMDTGQESLKESIEGSAMGHTPASYGFGESVPGQFWSWDAQATSIFGVSPTDNLSNPPTLD
jgi:hypothetical protein